MNPETNKFERLKPDTDQNEDPGEPDKANLDRLRRMVQQQTLLRPNGEPVPQESGRVGEGLRETGMMEGA